MPSLTFYGGVGEIGGNQILLADGNTRLFFDFGLPFGREGLYFEELLRPRAGLVDFLEMGLIPTLPGIYRPDLVMGPELWQRFPAKGDFKVDGVLLSHAHLDHSGYISFLNEDIPVYASALTAFIARAMQDSGQKSVDREVCYLNPRIVKDGRLSTESRGAYRQRNLAFADRPDLCEEAVQFWQKSPAKTKGLWACAASCSVDRVGELPVKCFPVDHSIPGASAFAVQTSKGWVVYTGDIRWHGRAGEKTRRFVEQIVALKPYALLCEGSRAGEETHITEAEVCSNALRIVKGERGLVVADFGPRNIDRLLSFYDIAKATGRKLVILPKDAYLQEAMCLVSKDIPSLNACPDVLIYKDPGGEGNWEKELWEKHQDRMVTANDIRLQPGGFLLCFSFWDIKNLIDIAPRGGLYLYSSSRAYDDEQKIDLQRLHRWVDHFNMRFAGEPEAGEGLHASGHASGPELLELVRKVSPKVLIPIHTEKPEYFWQNLQGSGIEVCPVKRGQEIDMP